MNITIKNIPFILLVIAVTFILSSCSEDAEPLQSVSHPPEWNVVSAENFHGNKVYAVGSETCQPCHGADYSGGESGVACSDCHANFPHPENWAAFKQPQSHDTYLAGQNWNLDGCTSCHGLDYLGGNSEISCALPGCHVQTGGPEACNNCHGAASQSVANKVTWSPPEDLNGNTGTENIGVGAHQTHMVDSTWSTAYTRDCNLCHIDLSGFDDIDHIDENPGINMQFSGIATNGGAVQGDWQNASATCSGMYCHGNFIFLKSESANSWGYADSVIVGNNPDMIWTAVDGTQDSCGTCHGLPPTGHINVATCDACHGSVVDADFNIIDKTKHINGEIDLD